MELNTFIKDVLKLLIVLIFLCIFLSIVYNQQRMVRENLNETKGLKNELNILKKIFEYRAKKLTWVNIDFWLDFYEIRHPDIVRAQIKLETGRLRSKICIKNNNLFGMRRPLLRGCSNLIINDHLSYTDFTESILDYKIWQESCYRDSSEDYFLFLKRIGYAEDTTYIDKLKLIANESK